MAAASGMSLAQWHRALNEIQSVGIDCGSRVLSAGPTSKRQSTDPELLIDGGENAFDLCYHREKLDILGRAFSCLPERERQVISLYSRGLTMKQIAQLMHVDESRISQIHSVALVRLKACADSLLRPTNTKSQNQPLARWQPGRGLSRPNPQFRRRSVMEIALAKLQKLIDGKTPCRYSTTDGPHEVGFVMVHRRQVGRISDTWLADLTVHKRHGGDPRLGSLNGLFSSLITTTAPYWW